MQGVCNWLEASKGVYAQQDWVEACLEWIEQEQGRSLPVSRTREMVYEQWLHASLKEVVSRPCIPTSVVEQQASQITGRFIVQVDSLIDVGAAAYAQLQKIKGQSIDSVENKKNFESKPTRLLLLSLTDGVTDFQAMEYQPISQLNTLLTPGTKLLLQGTINCRLGTLLLSGDHVQVLGGGVESLMDVNQQKRILARTLNDESLAEDGNGRSGSAAVSTSDTVPRNSSTHQPSETGNTRDQNEVGEFDIEDLDLENFDEMESELQNAQEQWPEEIDFSPQDIPTSEEIEAATLREEDEREMLDEGGTRGPPREHSPSRTVGQKWRPPSHGSSVIVEDPGILPLDDVNRPGSSGLGPSADKRIRMLPSKAPPPSTVGVSSGISEHVGHTGRKVTNQRASPFKETETAQQHGRAVHGTGKKTAVAAVRPMTGTVGRSVCRDGNNIPGAPTISTGGIPVVMRLPQIAEVWAVSPLVRVKAHFVRVTGKLKPCDGRWTVAVVIEDDSGSQLNVELSNQVLEKLIGFTAREFVEHIQPNKSDPIIKARGSKGFKHCQSYLAKLDCLMEIRKQSTFGDHPVVERLLDSEQQ